MNENFQHVHCLYITLLVQSELMPQTASSNQKQESIFCHESGNSLSVRLLTSVNALSHGSERAVNAPESDEGYVSHCAHLCRACALL